ncbi:hypothetical protein GAR06_00614 [Micromonospora saelicesensis]|nr:hypothetical protein GAR06_00614 [Micromonospora saelicesensis]
MWGGQQDGGVGGDDELGAGLSEVVDAGEQRQAAVQGQGGFRFVE